MSIRLKGFGLTLVELIAVLVILGAIAGVGATVLSDSLRAAKKTNEGAAQSDSGQLAAGRINSLIRAMAVSTGGLAFTSLPPNCSSGSCSFCFGTRSFGQASTPDAALAASTSAVSLTLGGGNLRLARSPDANCPAGAGDILLNNVAAMEWEFFRFNPTTEIYDLEKISNTTDLAIYRQETKFIRLKLSETGGATFIASAAIRNK